MKQPLRLRQPILGVMVHWKCSMTRNAYYDPPTVRLPFGSRVAYFDATILSRGKEKMLIPSAFYPGIIAESLKAKNLGIWYSMTMATSSIGEYLGGCSPSIA